jgi:predicted O-methyltransferase YrrM
MFNRLRNKVHGLFTLRSRLAELQHTVSEYKDNSCFPAGHYYSPIVSVKRIKEKQDAIWKDVSTNGIIGIDLNTQEQLSLVKSFEKFYSEQPFKEQKHDGVRYYFDNEFFCHTDALMLYSVIRSYQPKNIIEVGSGFSTAVILDTNQFFLNNQSSLTFIEPYPERLYSLLREEDKGHSTILVKDLQEVDPSYFDRLEKNDILFIDSTHVSKTGSDVNYVLFEILPRLKQGVLIHFHDIFYPFEYPKGWVFEGRNWNEDYILRAFLSYNPEFKIKLFVDYLHRHHKYVFAGMPLFYCNTGGSIWLQKV